MSRRPALTTLVLQPGTSRSLTLFIVLVHLGGAAAVILAALPLLGRTLLLMGLLGSLVYGLAVHASRCAPWAIREARRTEEGGWELNLMSGAEISSVMLLSAGFVGQHFAVLNFQTSRLGHRTLVLTADSIDSDNLRRLRLLRTTRSRDQEPVSPKQVPAPDKKLTG